MGEKRNDESSKCVDLFKKDQLTMQRLQLSSGVKDLSRAFNEGAHDSVLAWPGFVEGNHRGEGDERPALFNCPPTFKRMRGKGLALTTKTLNCIDAKFNKVKEEY